MVSSVLDDLDLMCYLRVPGPVSFRGDAKVIVIHSGTG